MPLSADKPADLDLPDALLLSSYQMETLSYSFELVPTLKPPMVLLKRPLLGEVFGAG